MKNLTSEAIHLISGGNEDAVNITPESGTTPVWNTLPVLTACICIALLTGFIIVNSANRLNNTYRPAGSEKPKSD